MSSYRVRLYGREWQNAKLRPLMRTFIVRADDAIEAHQLALTAVQLLENRIETCTVSQTVIDCLTAD